MNILILGAGGREHAFALKLSQSNKLSKLYVAPGNAGTAQCAINVHIDPVDFQAVKNTVLENDINMVIVGPEAPLVAGVHDFFLQDEALKNIPVIGPQKDGAELEGSKEFSKKFMKKHGVPTAAYEAFTKETLDQGKAFLETLKPPFVLKADGLAAGKGVLILNTLEEAKAELEDMLSNEKFGAASSKVVIEEFLDGIELSVFVLTDGKSYKILPSAKDYKRIGEGDTGLNTGGMGAISPVPFANREFMDKVENQIIIPTVKGLRKENIEYSGFIFFGLILVKGDPYVIEYNCRLGDPETEVILPRLKSDLLDLFDGIATDTLSERDVEIDPKSAGTVMLVSGGYPEKYKTGEKIQIGELHERSVLFHAGTKQENGEILTAGGRVISVTSFGKDIESSVKNSYTTISNIHFNKMNYRKDIGKDVIKKVK